MLVQFRVSSVIVEPFSGIASYRIDRAGQNGVRKAVIGSGHDSIPGFFDALAVRVAALPKENA